MPPTGVEVAGALEFVLRERLLRVALHGLGEGLLVPALRHPQLHRRAAQPTEPVLHLLDVRWQHGDENLARHRRRGLDVARLDVGLCCLFAVELGEKLLDEDGEPGVGIGILDRLDGLLHHPAALTPHPATADVENLHGHLEFVGGERDDVGVGAAAEDDGLLLQRPPQRADVVAQPRRGLEVQLLRCRAHPILQLAHEPVGAPGEEVAEVFNDAACSSALTRPTHGAEHLSM